MGGRAASFGRVADAYERGRPGHPVEAIRWLLGPTPLEVVDLGAGSGKLTRPLIAEGHAVIAAVEPLAELREELQRVAPAVPALGGRAEDIPLPDGCADAVTVGQAFHWFDHREALPEIARVLRPGGILAMLWTRRDKSVAWVEAISRLTQRQPEGDANGGGARALSQLRPRWVRVPRRLTRGRKRSPGWKEALGASPLFEGLEREIFSNEQRVDLAGLLDRVSSSSSVASRSPHEREEVLSQVRSLWEEHPDLAGRSEVTFPYRTLAFRSRRR
jgi:SAM-dependent methyltransferase